MAEIAYTEVSSEKRTRVFKWETVTENDTCQELDLGGLQGDITMVVIGTFGSGGVGLQGSHDNSTWVDVVNPQHSAIDITADGYDSARDAFRFMRPATPGGTSVDVDITLAITRAG